VKRLTSPKYKKLIKFLEDVMADPRMTARSRLNASEKLAKILLQSEQVAEKRAARRERDKVRAQKATEELPPPPDPSVAHVNAVVSSVMGSKQ
jgi:hypothetical protein